MPRYFFDIETDPAVADTQGADLPDDEMARAFADGLASTLPRAGRSVDGSAVVIRHANNVPTDPLLKPAG